MSGIFDSLLGMNTSSGTQAGAAAAQAALDATNQSNAHILRNTTGQANQALTTNTNAGLGALNQGYGSAINALTTGGQQAQNELATGVKNATGTVLGGNANYQPFLTGGQGASTMLANSLGLNGAGGNAAATAAFQTSPGYNFQVDQSTGAAERAAAAAGGLGSGSVLDAITRLGSNLANTEYGNWQSNLQSLGTQGLNAANSISSNNSIAGQMQYGGGATGATLANTNATSVGQAYANQATGAGNLYSTLGQGLSNNLTGLGQNIANSSTALTEAAANDSVTAGQAQDAAANTNSSVLSKLLGGVLGAPLSPTSLSASAGPSVGLNINPIGGATTVGGAVGTGLMNTVKGFL